jgi:hypothetical protein
LQSLFTGRRLLQNGAAALQPLSSPELLHSSRVATVPTRGPVLRLRKIVINRLQLMSGRVISW